MKHCLLVLFLFIVSCAPEQSAEERRREDTDRAVERLSYAVGHYAGYLLNSPDEITPLVADIAVTNNPTSTGNKPLLTVSLQMGLFGGVSIASTSSSYDWGAGLLVANFAKNSSSSGVSGGGAGAGGPSGPGSGPGGAGNGTGGLGNGAGGNSTGFELRGYIVNGELTQGVIVGSHLGTRKVVLKKGADSDFVPQSSEYAYDVIWKPTEKEPDVHAVVKIKTKPLTHLAPGTSDLGYLPGLEGSLEFDSFASAPQNALATFYDPTTATLDLQFSEHSWIHTTDVSLSLDTQEMIAPKGKLSLGGVAIRELTLRPVSAPAEIISFPPSTYLGIYQGAPTALKYKAVAYLNFLGGTSSNTLELPFLSFPKMRLELDICTGTVVMSQAVFNLTHLDYLKHKAIFHRPATERDPLEITFSNQWSKLMGTLLQVDPHTGGKQPSVTLLPNVEVARLGCEVVPK